MNKIVAASLEYLCILPVTKLNGIVIGSGKLGEVTWGLLNTWSENVGVDIVEQIKSWDNSEGKQNHGPSPYSFN